MPRALPARAPANQKRSHWGSSFFVPSRSHPFTRSKRIVSPDRERARAAERKYRQTARGREVDAAKKRRKRARHPKEAIARIMALRAHGERVRAIARNRMAQNEPMLPGPSVEDTRRQEMKRLSALIRNAEDDRSREGRDEVERPFATESRIAEAMSYGGICSRLPSRSRALSNLAT